MPFRPVIGISVESKQEPDEPRSGGSLKLNWNYAQAVADAGGIPILIPPQADAGRIAEMIHGWVIPGGLDIDAAHFGEANHPEVELQDPARFEAERALYLAVPRMMPILGICYGCQLLNVLQGGTLIQHLPDEVGHSGHSGGLIQRYTIQADSQLAREAGVQVIEGKSYHHQAVGRLGDRLKVTAAADDGTVEAIESTDRPWTIGVQWHPERTPEDDASLNLFRSFIRAASDYAETRRPVPA